MGVRLDIENRLNGARTRTEIELPRLVLGRGVGSDVLLPHDAVSPSHCVLRLETGGASVVDEGSTHGTELGGTRLVVHRARAVRSGDVLSVGPFRITVTLGVPAPTGAATEERARVARALVASPEPRALVVENGPRAGERLELPREGTIAIGRDPGNALALDDAELSRIHATVELAVDHAVASDAGSKNGLRVGGRVVSRRALRHGDVLELGAYRVRFEDPSDARVAAATEAKAEGPLPDLPEPNTADAAEGADGHETSGGLRDAEGAELAEDPDAIAAEVLDEPAAESPRRDAATTSRPAPANQDLADRLVWALALIVLVGSLLGAAYLFGQAAQ